MKVQALPRGEASLAKGAVVTHLDLVEAPLVCVQVSPLREVSVAEAALESVSPVDGRDMTVVRALGRERGLADRALVVCCLSQVIATQVPVEVVL
jgi:hypothetical protein